MGLTPTNHAWALNKNTAYNTTPPITATKVPQMRATLVAVMGGLVLYAVFLFKAHAWLVGVSPMGL